MWHIQHGLESIVYAVDWNLARENVFSGAAWLGGAGGGGAEVIEQLRKPTALICSSRGVERPSQMGGRSKRDEQLIGLIKSCVTRGGTALIPVDSSARVLELAYILEHAWRKDVQEHGPFETAKLYLTGRSMASTIRYARTMLEWMDDNINREFEAVQDNQRRPNGDDKAAKDGGPFDFKYVKIVERKAQILKLLSANQDNVQSTGRDSRNVLILTDKPGAVADTPTLAGSLWDFWQERKNGVSTDKTDSGDDLEFVYGGGRELEIREETRQALEGEELSLYQQWLAQRQLQENVQGGGVGGMEASADAVDDASSESSLESEDSDGEQQGRVLNISATMGQARKAVRDEDLGINILMKKKGTYDFDRFDEFGEVIRPEDFLRAEEKVDDAQDALHAASGGDNDVALGKKRRWEDAATNARNGGNKRPNLNRRVSEEGAKADEADEFDDVEDVEEVDPSGPSRLVVSTETVAINLRLAYVDFSGLHDKRSLNMLIPLIQPRKLILNGEANVFTPDVGEMVDASVDTNAWTLKLADSLVKKLKWQNVRGLSVVTITGQLLGLTTEDKPAAPNASAEDGANKRQKTADAGSESPAPAPASDATAPASLSASGAIVPTLDILSNLAVAKARTWTQPLHVGDLRLADLRKEMQAAGYSAEFRGEGTLLVDGVVAVRKTAAGKIEVVGTAGDGIMAARQRARSTRSAR
ncbi:unnamed protein product [Parascedosporium putredinis]|uniref:Cleavage and polyadenylation specificity factor subunit 2 n=1 Tax=Parascedosporium putredinis TaxID=1442378 RepID=A0A9P1H7Q0_9PEZI|nr:unnamed protein product [Parascedosporium putredinis]CAI8000064.1 unnamed protein product [Parascedosporium putredinis]